MEKKTNEDGKITQFEEFKEKLILKLQNYSLQKLNPIFEKAAFHDYEQRIHVTFPILDVKIFPALHPFSTLAQPEYLPAPAKDKELISWTAWSKHSIVIEHLVMQSRYEILQLEDVPFYIRLFCDAAKESFKSSIVFVADGLPSEFGVSVYPQRNYKRSKSEDLMIIAGHLLGKVDDKETQKRVKYICRNHPFRKVLDEILKLSKQPIQAELSYCLACGAEVAKEEMFCNSREVHGTKNPGNCRDKFHNWLRRRLGIGSLAAEREARESFYRDLQDIIIMTPLSAFETFQDKHRDLYDERPRGPKKRG